MDETRESTRLDLEYEQEMAGEMDILPKFTYRHQYDEAADARERLKTDLHDFEPTLTQQHLTTEVDLNVMVERMGIKDGSQIPSFFHESITADKFRDVTDIQDLGFRGALEQTKAAADAFNLLPATIRKRFGNDPAELMQFLQDKDNHEEAVKLGLLTKLPQKLPAGVTDRRELRAWIKQNPAEAEELGLTTAANPPSTTPPKQTP